MAVITNVFFELCISVYQKELKIIRKNRVHLSIMLVIALVIIARMESMGIQCATVNGVYTLSLSFPPISFALLAILVIAYIIAMRQPSPRNADQFPAASLTRRFLSFIIDFIVNVIISGAFFTLISLLINGAFSGGFSWQVQRPYQETKDSIYVVLFVLSGISTIVLFGLPVSINKQSAGGQIMGIYIHSKQKISLLKSTLRSFFGFITFAAAVLSVPSAWANNDKKMWHDSFFDTYPKFTLNN